MKKKAFLAILICFLMLGNMIPATAYAVEDTETNSSSVDLVEEESISDTQGASEDGQIEGSEDSSSNLSNDVIASSAEEQGSDISGEDKIQEEKSGDPSPESYTVSGDSELSDKLEQQTQT